MLFIVIMVRIYTLPLFAVRPMYLTMRAFKKAFNDVILSRRAIHNMNTWYPDATPEELAATDNVSVNIDLALFYYGSVEVCEVFWHCKILYLITIIGVHHLS